MTTPVGPGAPDISLVEVVPIGLPAIPPADASTPLPSGGFRGLLDRAHRAAKWREVRRQALGVTMVVLTNLALTAFLRSITSEVPWLPDAWRNAGVLMTLVVCAALFRMLRLRIESEEERLRNEVARCERDFEAALAGIPAARRSVLLRTLRNRPPPIEAVLNRFAVSLPAQCARAADLHHQSRTQRAAVIYALLTTAALMVYFVLWKQTVFTMRDGTGQQVVIPLVLPEPVAAYVRDASPSGGTRPLGEIFALNRNYLVEAFEYDYSLHTAMTGVVFGVAYLLLCLCATAAFAYAYSRLDAVLDLLGLGTTGGVRASTR